MGVVAHDQSVADPDDDLGLFGPDSVSWRVHREPVLWLAGIRALFLQALHPRAVEGVVQNSDLRRDSWSRLQRTAEYVATVVYGTASDARLAGQRVRGIHRQLRARDPVTGEPFRIDDPELLRWVHVCEVESFVTTVRRAGLALTDAEVDQYYAEQVRAAELVGLDAVTVPASAPDVAEYLRAVRRDLALTSSTRDVARFLALPPMPRPLAWTVGRPAWLAVAGTSFALLPRWARRLYGTPGWPVTEHAATLAVRGLRRVVAVLPIDDGPIYRAAMDRVAGASASKVHHNDGNESTRP